MGGPDALYEPGDWMWRVNRETVLLLSGPRALLMQIAHPLVAAGVAEHSHFEQDPLARMRGTLDAMLGMIYGSREEAEQHASRVNAIHEHVHGTISVDTPGFPAGSAYDALDPDLLFWVQATLIDSAICAYECFVGALSPEAKHDLYEGSKSMAPLLRLPLDRLPATYVDFRREVDDMIEGPTLTLTDDARAIANAVLYPRIWHLPRAVWRAASVIPLGLLPPTLRDRYGFAWNRSHELAWRGARASLRLLLPLLPQTLRIMPRARLAERERVDSSKSNLVPRVGSPS